MGNQNGATQTSFGEQFRGHTKAFFDLIFAIQINAITGLLDCA